MPPTQILLSAGEASGDMYAASLASELKKRADVAIFGMGGAQMRAAGVETPADACCSSYPGSVLRQMGQRSMKRLWRQKLGILARAAR